MDGIAQRIRARKDLHRQAPVRIPDVAHGNAQILGKTAIAVDAYAAGVRAEMATTGKTIAAESAHQVPFTTHKVAWFEARHVRPDLSYAPNILMPDHHGYWNRL